MPNHPSSRELDLVRRLQGSLSLLHSPVDELIVLGRLYIEPMHEEDHAIAIFEAVLRRDPHNQWATFWLCYCYLHYRMTDEALEAAEALLTSCVAVCENPSGALYWLLAEVLADLAGPWRDTSHEAPRPSAPSSRELQLLDLSVQLEPGWVNNRMSLAWAYERAGRIASAIRQLEWAKGNVLTRAPDEDIINYYFEVLVTGRLVDVEDRINNQLARLL